MYTVFRWIDSDHTELIAVFDDETLADQFCVFYAMLHMISVDLLTVGYNSQYSFFKNDL